MDIPTLLVRTAGSLQLLQTAAIFAGQRGLAWTAELQRLTPLGRSFVYSIAAGIYLYVTGSGIIAVWFAEEIASSTLGLSLCVLQALAWTTRASFQLLSMHPVWDQQSRWLHYAMCVVYTSIACLYIATSATRVLAA